jgi:hypothetical protein
MTAKRRDFLGGRPDPAPVEQASCRITAADLADRVDHPPLARPVQAGEPFTHTAATCDIDRPDRRPQINLGRGCDAMGIVGYTTLFLISRTESESTDQQLSPGPELACEPVSARRHQRATDAQAHPDVGLDCRMSLAFSISVASPDSRAASRSGHSSEPSRSAGSTAAERDMYSSGGLCGFCTSRYGTAAG